MATLLARGSGPATSSTTGKHGATILTLVACTLAAVLLLAASVHYGTNADPILEPVSAAAE